MQTSYFWFRLFRTRGIGPKSLVSIARTLEKFQLQPAEIPHSKAELSACFPELAKILNSKIFLEDRDEIYQEYKQLEIEGVDIIYPGLSVCPAELFGYAEKYDISSVLFAKGPKTLLRVDGVSIVGSRNVSPKGIIASREIAANLANRGINVISGYAKGVDSEAHLGALKAQGTTTIVLGYGIKELRKKKDFKEYNWDRDVLVISQFQPNARWMARNAMARNKLVCALSRAVVVIESGPEKDLNGKMSGTFNAAKTALSMNLPLFVISPSFFDEPPRGNLDLIDLGGIELDPSNGAKAIAERIWELKKEVENTDSDNLQVQMSLFQR